jgi:hypothetical protein
MNTQNERTPHTQLESQFAGHAVAQAAVELAAPTAADRLYQFAALTAGIFLLATLL